MYILAQVIGFVAFSISLLAYHKNKKEKILGNMIMSNILNLIHYLLLGAYSACMTKIMAIMRDVVIISKNKYKILNSKLIFMIFLLLYTVIAIVTYNNIWSLFPIFAAIIYFIPIWNGNEMIVRRAGICGSFLWLIYNICVLSMSGILTNIVSIISTFIAIKNYKKKEIGAKQEENEI